MNAIMTSTSAAHQLQRYDAIRRRNAEQAYHRQAEYNGRNQKMLDDLEALLTGKKELDGGQESRDLKKLDVRRANDLRAGTDNGRSPTGGCRYRQNHGDGDKDFISEA